ncbi:MAG: phosphodiester glycosidase family protein [Clostridiaceae bacterium]
MKLNLRLSALALAFCLLLTALPAAARAESESADEAADLTGQCVLTPSGENAEKAYRVTDAYTESYLELSEDEPLTVTLPTGESAQGLYLEWYDLPGSYAVEQYDAAGTLLSSAEQQPYINCYFPLDAAAAAVKIVCTDDAYLSSVYVYGQGTLPQTVQVWEPTLTAADLLFIGATPEAAVTDFYALLALYSVEHQIPTVLTVLEKESRTEQGDLLAGLWRMGIKNYPVFGTFSALNNDAYKRVRGWWGVNATHSFVQDQLEVYGEKIVITHENSENAFNSAAQFTAEVVLDNTEDAEEYESIQKVYCVAAEGTTKIDLAQALITFEGMSLIDAANDAYQMNADMRRFHKTLTPSSTFTLAFSAVGEDVSANDLLENIDTSTLSGYVSPTPSPTPSPEPTPTPEPTPMATPEATPVEAATEESTSIGDMEQYMNWGLLIIALLGIIGSLWVVVSSFRYLSARYGTGRALISALLPLIVAGALICAFQFWVRPMVEDVLAEEQAAKIAAAATPVPTPEPTGTPVVLTPEPSAEVTDETEGASDEETESSGAVIGVDDDQYYRSESDPEELIVIDAENGHWEYKTDTLSIIIDRVLVTEPKLNRYFVAHIRMRGEDGFRTVQAAENRNGKGAIRPWILARDTKSVLLVTGDNLIESDAGYKGILIRDGILFQDDEGKDCMAMYPDLTMRLFAKNTTSVEDLLADGVRDVFSFGPVLVENGAVNEDSGEHRLSRRNNPRTGIGMVEAGHFVVIVCDGRQPESSLGMFLPEFAQLFVDEGCSVAYNLDGGVSACMVFMGEQLNQHGNKKVGTYQDSYQRRVPDGLVWGYSDQVPEEDDPVFNTGTSETATP